MKSVLLKIIAYIPINFIRIALYRVIFGYNIGNNVIIKKSYLSCNKVEIADDVTILSGNIIICDELKIGSKTSILEKNRIVGKASLTIGEKSRIIDEHFIDLNASVFIGDRTWIAGKRSQIWTHGSLHTKVGKDLSVHIDDDCYIASSVMIAPGTHIAKNNLIGLGTVLNGTFEKSNTVIYGNPAQVMKENINWRENW